MHARLCVSLPANHGGHAGHGLGGEETHDTMTAEHAAGLPQALGVPQIVKAAEALVARVDTSGGPASAPSRSASREMPPLQAPSGQPSPG